jgi:2-dehydro-3-deoxy-D-gluconate 5-dehydrogenase
MAKQRSRRDSLVAAGAVIGGALDMAVPLDRATLNGSAGPAAGARAVPPVPVASGKEQSGTAGPFDLTGRVALVTGAASGNGKAVAVGLAGAGADVVLLGYRESLAATAAAVRALGRHADELLLDLPDYMAVGSACERLLADRQIDVLVNDMGVTRRGRLGEIRPRQWRELVARDLDWAFVLAQFLGQPMVRRRSGKIINTAPVPSFEGVVHPAAYAAVRQGLTALTRALAAEWAPFGVQVNAVATGYPAAYPSRPADLPRSLAGVAMFLASPAADHINGQVLVVDGTPAE